MSHTPGPWGTGIAKNIRPPLDPETEVAIVVGSRPQPGKKSSVVCIFAPADDLTEEDVANAKLIAAAPDLLDCLEWAFKRVDVSKCAPAAMKMYYRTQEVLSKAKGTDLAAERQRADRQGGFDRSSAFDPHDGGRDD